MNLAFRFFAFLERSEWAAAERVWGKIREMELDGDWLRGYANALMGMMVSLRSGTSHAQPYILEVREYEIGELQDVKGFFRKATERKMNKKFDKGFFQGWHQYIGFLLRKTKE